jgi:hypothetical protein
MKALVLLVLGFAGAAMADGSSVQTVCEFAQLDGVASFAVGSGLENVGGGATVNVASKLTINDQEVGALRESCALFRGTFNCAHRDGAGMRYQLIPQIDFASRKVKKARLMYWAGDASPVSHDATHCE